MRAIPQMQSLGVPVIFDATHSVQEPGGLGAADRRQSGDGRTAGPRGGCHRRRRPVLRNPSPARRRPSDGPNMVPLANFAGLIERLLAIRHTVEKLQ